jgi:anti-sigma factor RsiW
MNPENHFELSSAFVDGEMTLEESHAFELDLANSPELREEVQGISAVRDLLRTNGQEAIPAGMLNLIIAVVGAAEENPEAASIDHALAEAALDVTNIADRPKTQRRIAQWIAGMAAAACLLVVIGMPSTGSVSPPIASSVQTHAARSSLDEPAVDKMAASSISAGFLR